MRRADCSQCGEPLAFNPVRCTSCGWRPEKTSAADPLRAFCCHEDRGQRCAEPGALAVSTHGADEWYCRTHYPPFAGHGGIRAVAPEGYFAAVRAMLAAAVGQGDYREWARRIQAREASGEVVGLIPVQAARDALAARPGPVAHTFQSVSGALGVHDPEAEAEREAIRHESLEAALVESGDRRERASSR